jgi:hypothetical protein
MENRREEHLIFLDKYSFFLKMCRFCVGDQFYLMENKILCHADYTERTIFASLPANPHRSEECSVFRVPCSV